MRAGNSRVLLPLRVYRFWSVRFSGHKENDAETGEDHCSFEFFGAWMEALEVEAGRVVGRCRGDVASCLDTIALHRWENAGLQIDGDGEHDGNQHQFDGVELPPVDAAVAPEQKGRYEKEDSTDQADAMQDAERSADYESGLMSAGENVKCDGSQHEGKEQQATLPENDGEQADETESGCHTRRDPGR